jgi:hypothetical protein
LDGQQTEAVIGARMAGCTWQQMGAAVGLDAAGARNRWARLTAGYEAVGLLPADPAAPAQRRLLA